MTAVCRKYKTIVIDPPWNISLCQNVLNTKVAEKLSYNTMSDNEILNFPINNFADNDCDLFLWTTKGKLPFAFDILKKWKFKYKNILVWNKGHGLCVNGFNNVLEFALIGTKGKSNISFTNPLKMYIQEGHYNPKKNPHSKKPDKFYAALIKSTKEPRIDIFARKRHYGFDAYGDQVEKEIEVPLMLASFHAQPTKTV